jgi:hypothetical protein
VDYCRLCESRARVKKLNPRERLNRQFLALGAAALAGGFEDPSLVRAVGGRSSSLGAGGIAPPARAAVHQQGRSWCNCASANTVDPDYSRVRAVNCWEREVNDSVAGPQFQCLRPYAFVQPHVDALAVRKGFGMVTQFEIAAFDVARNDASGPRLRPALGAAALAVPREIAAVKADEALKVFGRPRMGLKLHVAQAASQRQLVSASLVSLSAGCGALVAVVYQETENNDEDDKDRSNKERDAEKSFDKTHNDIRFREDGCCVSADR